MEVWEAALKKIFPGRGVAIAVTIAAALFLFAMWFFEWTKPSRSDLEGLLYVSIATNGPHTVWNSDGAAASIVWSAITSIADIRCRSESKRRQPSIRYYCLYNLVGPSQAGYRVVLGAEHNRGWARNGMADYGNYRLMHLSPEQIRDVLALRALSYER